MKRACGFVVFRWMNGQLEYLLLQASNGVHHWTPPKGHVDPGEEDLTTAFRETEEEAGLKSTQLKVLNGFQSKISYTAWGRPKESVYYLAELRDAGAPVLISEEHSDWCWAPVERACHLVSYAEMQGVLREAERFVTGAAPDARG
ncbi:bis(5'-nucleosyl)-tetraphosphatase [asymmetrical]-like [Pollicipes pollicipes]|uniref:bis(5'-nucleosyl)-tetraphosphatase [asymmetrical]-like n=1 Tax=Pollicipes pollicipes TaxID=41117 RepID=UPI001884D043|nr:bis(5'-nucleosyl)-tetraphosphatase [asymmetrical]-like [Pollicipes pollicipes]XP_037092592.1 bis(5'-nucleosyl)-tetraphosphatase [asymmetrical]-like [Pollicipes pollicipes]